MRINLSNTWSQLDWTTLFIYLLLLAWGWMSIYAAEYASPTASAFVWNDLSSRVTRQFFWIILSLVLALVIMVVHRRLFFSFSYTLYASSLFLLVVVLLFGKEVAGSRSWLEVGPINLQPSELTKYTTLLALATLLAPTQFRIGSLKNQLLMGLLVATPALLIVAQGDTGTALVYASMIFVMYRAGMNPTFILIGTYALVLFVLVLFVSRLPLIIGLVVLGSLVMAFVAKQGRKVFYVASTTVVSVVWVILLDTGLQGFLKPYQYRRLQLFVNPESDPFGYGWNTMQAKIALGAGGFAGKGYLEGTQTKFDFVPEKTTDFIFCTIGEEFGWLGSLLLVGLFASLIVRIVRVAERQNNRFAMLYGHGVAAFFFFHFIINTAMTVELFPVIGIPLPFVSYGGSSLLVFSIMLFTLLKLDMERKSGPSRLRESH